MSEIILLVSFKMTIHHERHKSTIGRYDQSMPMQAIQMNTSTNKMYKVGRPQTFPKSLQRLEPQPCRLLRVKAWAAGKRRRGKADTCSRLTWRSDRKLWVCGNAAAALVLSPNLTGWPHSGRLVRHSARCGLAFPSCGLRVVICTLSWSSP